MKIEFFKPDVSNVLLLPLTSSSLECGFPSPADDHLEERLDLNEICIKNRSSTFYARAKGSSMIGAGIESGDILVIDKSIEPTNNEIVVAVIDGDFTVKRISKQDGRLYLIPDNNEFKRIEVSEENNFKVWGVVTFVVKNTRRK